MRRVLEGADGERRDVAELPREFWGYTDKIILADRDDLHGVSVLEVSGIRVGVGRKQLL